MFTRLVSTGAALALIAVGAPAVAQSASDDARFQSAQARFDREYQIFRQEADRYAQARRAYSYDDRGGPGGYRQAPYDDRDEGDYDPARYYRSGPNYQERVLSTNDRVYAGNDGRYYCKRNDGTTGLIVGGAAGGILGNVIDGGHSRIVGTLLGGAAGALAGKAIDQNNSQVRCR